MNMKKNVRQTLCDALEELLEQQFKALKWSLPATDEGREIPRGQLEKADTQDVVDLMWGYYGEEGAPGVCIRVLEKINARDVAAKLRKALPWHVLGVGLQQVPTKADYRNHIQRKFQTMKDANSCPGQSILLKKRYSELSIVDCDWSKNERARKIKSTGQKHAELMEKSARSSITVEMLFKPDKHGLIPEVVVLLGAAGIGKTMTARKIMLDWASGQLYQDMFDYVFYIHCREMNLCTEERSMAEIILKQWPSEHAVKNVAKELLQEIFQNPKKILFLIDGLDELRLFTDPPEGQLCSDPWKKEPFKVLLSSLFQKKLLFDCYMIITTRPTALMKIDRFLQYSRYVEILGFSEKDREEYFHKFFQNGDQAKRAVRHIQHNGALFTMCSVPLVCWIMCTVLQEQLERGEDLGQTSRTLTAVYMLYLRFHHRQRKQEIQQIIKGLCALAAEGIWSQEILFREDMIRKHGLDREDSLSLFLNENIFKEGIECVCAYSFIHLSFQEFFAALHYLLEEVQSPVKLNKCVRTLLTDYYISRPDLQATVCFLFGLINEERKRHLKEMFGWNISPRIKEFLFEWVKKIAITLKFGAVIHCGGSSIFQFLYETQDETFVKHALEDMTKLFVKNSSLMELIATVYCLEHSCRLEELSIGYDYNNKEDEIDDERRKEKETVNQLLKAVVSLRSNLKELVINMYHCCLTEANCRDLAFLLSSRQTLTKLSLEHTFSDCPGLHLLCQGLQSPNCRLQTLKLTHFVFSEVSCRDFAQVLMKNQSLRKLHLIRNEVKVPGIKLLFEGLKHPNCQLDALSLFHCTLTGASCQDVAQVLSEDQRVKVASLFCNAVGDVQVGLLCNESRPLSKSVKQYSMDQCYLTATWSEELAQVLIKNLRLNLLVLKENVIGDTGMTLLWEGLTHPHCKAEMLALHEFQRTYTCSEKLVQVLIKSKRQQELFQELHGMQDTGMKILREWLKHPDCKVETLVLPHCRFTEAFSEKVAQILIKNQMLRVLFLELHGIEDTRILWEGLRHPECKVEELHLYDYIFTEACGENLAQVLIRNQRLKLLALHGYEIQYTGMKTLCEGLKHPECKVEKLCLHISVCYEELAQVLINAQRLKLLELFVFKEETSGIEILCEGLKHPECKVEKLCLHDDFFKEASYEALGQVLIQNRRLKELALHGTGMRNTRMKLLWEGLNHPDCKVEKLYLRCWSSMTNFYEELAPVLINNQRLKLLKLDMGTGERPGMKILFEGLKHPECKVEKLCLECWSSSNIFYEELAQVPIKNQRLRLLELNKFRGKDSGIKILCEGLKNPESKVEKLCLEFSDLTEAGCEALAQVLIKNQRLQVLCLRRNDLGCNNMKLLCEGLKHPDCTLQKLYLGRCRGTHSSWEAICTALITNPSLTEVQVSEARLEESERKQLCEALKDSGKTLRVNRRRIDMEDDGNSEELEESDHCRIGEQIWLSKGHEDIIKDSIVRINKK